MSLATSEDMTWPQVMPSILTKEEHASDTRTIPKHQHEANEYLEDYAAADIRR